MNLVSSSSLHGNLNTINFVMSLNKQQFGRKFKSNSAFFTSIKSFSYFYWNLDKLSYFCTIPCIAFLKFLCDIKQTNIFKNNTIVCNHSSQSYLTMAVNRFTQSSFLPTTSANIRTSPQNVPTFFHF